MGHGACKAPPRFTCSATPRFPVLRASHELSQRPSPQKQFPRTRLDSLIKDAVPAGGVTTATPSKKANKGKARK
jgi:hypothetical protein